MNMRSLALLTLLVVYQQEAQSRKYVAAYWVLLVCLQDYINC